MYHFGVRKEGDEDDGLAPMSLLPLVPGAAASEGEGEVLYTRAKLRALPINWAHAQERERRPKIVIVSGVEDLHYPHLRGRCQNDLAGRNDQRSSTSQPRATPWYPAHTRIALKGLNTFCEALSGRSTLLERFKKYCSARLRDEDEDEEGEGESPMVTY